uniref:Putative secreted peptide n=1 Tax=Anopheles braziliensis TaxID=58242 RepID=A0A2M3ZSM7_9DIPT
MSLRFVHSAVVVTIVTLLARGQQIVSLLQWQLMIVGTLRWKARLFVTPLTGPSRASTTARTTGTGCTTISGRRGGLYMLRTFPLLHRSFRLMCLPGRGRRYCCCRNSCRSSRRGGTSDRMDRIVRCLSTRSTVASYDATQATEALT